MSMYKNIYVNEEWNESSTNIQGVNGEILMFGETAFSSVTAALEAVESGNAIVIKVASGKYDGFTVVTEGVQSTPAKVVALDFDGGTLVAGEGEVTVADSGLDLEAQLSVINDLNAANAANGTIFVGNAEGADTTLIVGMGEANYVVGQDAAAVYGADVKEIFTIINTTVNSSTLNSTGFAGFVEGTNVFEVSGGAQYTNAEDIDASALYVGYDYTSSKDTAASKFTVASGTTVVGANALHVRQGSELIVDGTMKSGLVQLKDTTATINESGKLVQTHFGVHLRKSAEDGGSTLTVKGELAFELGANNMATTSTLDIDENGKLIVDGGKITSYYGTGEDVNDQHVIDINAGGAMEVNSGSVDVDSVINNGTFTVSGESTLNIATLSGEEVNFLDGAIIKDSTVGGNAFVAGNVTFSGDNTFNMLYDFGTLTDNYGTTANMQWTVEKGASLTLTKKDRYGLGYGDNVTINGNIAADGADAARATLTDDNADNNVKSSLFMHGLVAQESSGWNQTSYLTVNAAYVTIGSNNSFGNKPGNYGGDYYINFNNAVLDSSRITFYEAASTTEFNFKDSNVNTGTFMTRDKDSVFTLENTKLVSNTATNGTDEGNYNAGTLNITAGSELTYTAQLVNEGGVINVADSTLTANGGISNKGTLNVSGGTLSATTITNNSDNFTVNNGTLKADKFENDAKMYIGGESTIQVEDATGSGFAIRVNDGAVLNDSYIKAGDNATTRFLGSVTLNGGFSAAYFETKPSEAGEEAAAAEHTLTIEDGTVVNVSYGADFKGNYTISGGTIVLSGGNASGSIWGFVFQDGTFDIDTDIVVDGMVNESADATPIHFTNVNATVHSDITHKNSGGEVIYISESSVEMVDGSTWTANAGVHVNDTSSLSVIDSSIVAGSVVVASTASLSLTVTDEKLASLGADTYYMIEQTSSTAADLDLGVTYNGKVYNVGDSITIGDVVYNITNGDGNDIAIEAAAVAVTLDSSVTSNGLDKFAQAGEFFELHDSYAERIQNLPEMIVVNGTNTLDTDKSKYYFYTDRDLTIAGGTLDVSEAGRFYFMDTVAANGTAAADADLSDVATVTIEEGATLKGYINLGQAIDNGDDVDENGNVTRDGGAMNMVVKGTLDQKNLYVNSGSTLTVTETGKVTHYSDGGDNHIRANAKVVVNGTGKDGDVQFASNWWSIRGGEMEFNNTNAETGTLRLNADNENVLVTGDTTASLTVNNSRLDAYAIEIDNADSSFTAKDSIIETTLLENAGTAIISGDTAVNANTVTNSGVIYVENSSLNFNKMNETGVGAQLFINGNSTISGSAIVGDTKLRIGQVDADYNGAADVDANNNAVVTDDNNITLDVDNISITFGNVYNANVGLAKDVAFTLTGTYGNGYIFATNSTFDMNGHTLTVNGAFMLDATITDGTLNFNGEGGEYGWSNIVFQNNASTIESDATVNVLTGSAVSIYEDLTVKGKFNDNRTSGNAIGVGHIDASDYTDGATLKISQGAEFTSAWSSMTVYGANAAKDIESSSLIVENGAKFALGGTLTNHSSITVDAGSSFSAGAIVNTGTFNSSNAGEMVVLGDMTVSGNINTADLVLKSGSVLSAASITVTNLTLAIGSALTLTGSGSSADNIRVIGDIKPAQAEFTLVTQNWFGGSSVWYDQNGDNVKNEGEIFEVKGDAAGLSGINFVSKDGNLYVADFGATPTGVYISDDLVDATPGTKVTVNGATYTVGTDAFSSVNDMPNSMDKSLITEIALGNGDHVSDIDDTFSALETIHVEEGKRIVDTEASVFDNDLIINNDGHLEADIKVSGDVEMTNTSSNTFVGSLTGDNVDVTNTSTGKVTDAALIANDFGSVYVENLGVIENTSITAVDGMVDLSGNGTWDNVDVTTDALYLNGINFTLDSDSTVKSVYMGTEDAGTLTVDGAVIDQIIGGDDAAGTVDFKSANNTAGAESGLKYTAIEDVDKVILSGGSHEFGSADEYREYYMNTLEIGNANLTWNWTDTDSLEYNIGTPINDDSGMINVTNTSADAALNFTQVGEYSLNKFDVSGFDGKVSISEDSTLNLKEDTDYFKDGAEITVTGDLNLGSEAAGGKSTGMDFNGTGDINVNTNHTFTATAALDGFSGDLTIADGKTLTLNGVNDTAAMLNGSGKVVAKSNLTLDGYDTTNSEGALDNFTGDIKADGANVNVNLNSANITEATFSGTGTVNVNADQTFEADGALDDLEGTLNNVGKVITLDGENTIAATVKGSGDIIANADQSFTGDVSDYAGSYEAADGKNVTFTAASTLATSMTVNGEGEFVFESQDADVTINSDSDATDLTIYDNDITIASGAYGSVEGEEGSELIINAKNISAESVTVDELIINAGMSLAAGIIDADSTYVFILNPGEQGPAITVTNNTSDFGDIFIDSWSSEFTTPFTIVDSSVGQSYADKLVFLLNSTEPGTGIKVDGKAELIDGKYIRVYTQNGDLLIGNYNATSNVVYVNSDWNEIAGTVYQWQGVDGTTDRIIDVDASKTLVNAINILAADSNGEGQIFVVKGSTYKTPDAMMTTLNKVTNLTISGNAVDPGKEAIDLGDVIFEGGIVALDGARSGELTLENISVSGNIYGGAEIAAGVTAGADTDSTSLTLDGGYYLSAQIAGGSYVAGNYTVGSSELIIKNTTGGEMAILGRVLGGSVVTGSGSVVQEAAGVMVDLTGSQEITIRGDIYAAGAGNVQVDESVVVFTGDADKLSFTGRVSGQAFGNENAATSSELVFADFDGVFKGLIQGFDTITISGNSELEFSRKQTLTAETDLVFDLTGRTSDEAMFVVNQFGWTYDESITINAFDGISDDYILIDNYTGDFAADFTYTIAGNDAVIGTTLTVNNNEYTLNVVDDSLVLTYVGNNGVGLTDGSNVVFDQQTLAVGTDGTALSFSDDKTASAEAVLSSSKVQGNVYTGRGEIGITATGNTTISGNISGYATLVEFTVESGKTAIDGVFSSGNGEDLLAVNDNAELVVNEVSTGNSTDNIEIGVGSTIQITGEDISTGNGNDVITIKDGAAVSVAEDIELGNNDDILSIGSNVTLTADEINGGIDNDEFIMGKGSAVTATSLTMFEKVTVDVDSILNASSYANVGSIAVDGISDLTTDFAGAKVIVSEVMVNNNVTLDGVDAILGTATQIAGTESVATDDDVWASLNKVDGNLVVAWGRTEVEVGAALEAFSADSTLSLGEALVAVDDSLLNGYDSTDSLNKKNNGTLA